MAEMCHLLLSENGSIGRKFDELPKFHSCFEISVENCGTEEKKATNSSTTVVVYIYTTVVVTVD